MTVVITRNVEDRVRGFLASCMLELASGVYSSNINASVRERVVAVLSKWNVGDRNDSAIVLWQDRAAPGGQAFTLFGEPALDLVQAPGVVLTRRALTEEALRSLTTQIDPVPF